MMKILLFAQLVIGLLLVTVILLQRTSSDGVGTLSGDNMGVMNARSAANFLTRTTVFLVFLFFVNSIVLANLSSRKASSVLDKKTELEQVVAEPQEPQAAETVPIAQ